MELLTEFVVISANTATLKQTLCCSQEQTASVDVKQRLINCLMINFNQTDGITISDFITNLVPHKKVLLLLGGLSLPFDDASVVKRFVASVGKFTNCAQRSYMSLRHRG